MNEIDQINKCPTSETFHDCQQTPENENFVFAIFLQEPLRTTQGHHLRPLGAPELVKRGPFWPPEVLKDFDQKKFCILIFALARPFGLRFWLGVSQIDRTDRPKKMAYSGSFSDQLIISNGALHFQTLGPKNSMQATKTNFNFFL